jgi:hypothetical protein
MYFEPLELTEFDGDTFTAHIEAGKVAWCEQFATESLERALKRELGCKVTVVFVAKSETQSQLPLFAKSSAPIVDDAGDDFDNGYGEMPY